MDILLVDDDEALRRVMGRMLAERGHDLKMAASGQEALRCMEEALPDLVISDVQMPGMSGIEVLREAGGRFPETPVVLMTALGEVGETDAAFQYGAYGYLQKPIKAEALLAGIRRLEERLLEEKC